jgi:hypothetical protein
MSGSGAAYFYLFRRGSGAAEMHRARLETQFPGVRFVSTALAGLSA